ncbi:hypothetical protein EVA_13023 [gut metagenome]|uniref:Uncharacterized protein n=1 Tax=gut metagenome TaxID=749906 RepID=J9FV52_9ZZZZ
MARDSHHGYLQFKEYASIGFNFSFSFWAETSVMAWALPPAIKRSWGKAHVNIGGGVFSLRGFPLG